MIRIDIDESGDFSKDMWNQIRPNTSYRNFSNDLLATCTAKSKRNKKKLSVILELGWLGFKFKHKVFNCRPTMWSVRVALGLIAVTIVWGDSSAIRGFGT